MPRQLKVIPANPRNQELQRRILSLGLTSDYLSLSKALINFHLSPFAFQEFKELWFKYSLEKPSHFLKRSKKDSDLEKFQNGINALKVKWQRIALLYPEITQLEEFFKTCQLCFDFVKTKAKTEKLKQGLTPSKLQELRNKVSKLLNAAGLTSDDDSDDLAKINKKLEALEEKLNAKLENLVGIGQRASEELNGVVEDLPAQILTNTQYRNIAGQLQNLLSENLQQPALLVEKGSVEPIKRLVQAIKNKRNTWALVTNDISAINIELNRVVKVYQDFLVDWEKASPEERIKLAKPKACYVAENLGGPSQGFYYVDNELALKMVSAAGKENEAGAHAVARIVVSEENGGGADYYKKQSVGMKSITPAAESGIGDFYDTMARKMLPQRRLTAVTTLAKASNITKDDGTNLASVMQSSRGMGEMSLHALLDLRQKYFWLYNKFVPSNTPEVFLGQILPWFISEDAFLNHFKSQNPWYHNGITDKELYQSLNSIILQFGITDLNGFKLAIQDISRDELLRSLAIASTYPFLVQGQDVYALGRLTKTFASLQKLFPNQNLSQQHQSLENLFGLFDNATFTAFRLANLIINPTDGKSDNLMVSFERDPQGNVTKIFPIGIDNDEALCDAITKNKFGHYPGVKDVLAFFPCMANSLDQGVVDVFLKQSPDSIYLEWLVSLQAQNLRYKRANFLGMFLYDDHYDGSGDRNLDIPFRFDPEIAKLVYYKIKKIQEIIKWWSGEYPNRAMTHQDLFNLMEPVLAKFYAKTAQKNNYDPKESLGSMYGRDADSFQMLLADQMHEQVYLMLPGFEGCISVKDALEKHYQRSEKKEERRTQPVEEVIKEFITHNLTYPDSFQDPLLFASLLKLIAYQPEFAKYPFTLGVQQLNLFDILINCLKQEQLSNPAIKSAVAELIYLQPKYISEIKGKTSANDLLIHALSIPYPVPEIVAALEKYVGENKLNLTLQHAVTNNLYGLFVELVRRKIVNGVDAVAALNFIDQCINWCDTHPTWEWSNYKREFQQARATLIACNPDVALQASLNVFSYPADPLKPSALITGVRTGSRMVKPEFFDQIFDKNGDPKKVNQTGERAVPHFYEEVPIANGEKIKRIAMHAKFGAIAPSDPAHPSLAKLSERDRNRILLFRPREEEFAHSLARLVGFESVIAQSELVNLQTPKGMRPVLLSNHVEGIDGLHGFDYEADKMRQLNADLDTYSSDELDPELTKLILLEMLLKKGDAKQDNYIVQTYVDENGRKRFRIVAIDSDDILNEQLEKGDDGHRIVKARSAIFMLSQMSPNCKKRLNRQVCEEFAKLDVNQVLTNLLQGLDSNTQALGKVFNQPTDNTNLEIKFSQRQINELARTFSQIKNQIAENPQITGYQLLESVMPDTAAIVCAANNAVPAPDDFRKRVIEYFKFQMNGDQAQAAKQSLAQVNTVTSAISSAAKTSGNLRQTNTQTSKTVLSSALAKEEKLSPRQLIAVLNSQEQENGLVASIITEIRSGKFNDKSAFFSKEKAVQIKVKLRTDKGMEEVNVAVNMDMNSVRRKVFEKITSPESQDKPDITIFNNLNKDIKKLILSGLKATPLTSLVIPNCVITYEQLEGLLRNSPDIEHINISGCKTPDNKGISKKILLVIEASCKKLRKLEARDLHWGDFAKPNQTAGKKLISTVSKALKKEAKDTSDKTPIKLPKLQRLDLSGNPKLSYVNLIAPLISLRVDDTPNLNDLEIKGVSDSIEPVNNPDLEVLSLLNCPQLSPDVVDRLVVQSPKLLSNPYNIHVDRNLSLATRTRVVKLYGDPKLWTSNFANHVQEQKAWDGVLEGSSISNGDLSAILGQLKISPASPISKISLNGTQVGWRALREIFDRKCADQVSFSRPAMEEKQANLGSYASQNDSYQTLLSDANGNAILVGADGVKSITVSSKPQTATVCEQKEYLDSKEVITATANAPDGMVFVATNNAGKRKIKVVGPFNKNGKWTGLQPTSVLYGDDVKQLLYFPQQRILASVGAGGEATLWRVTLTGQLEPHFNFVKSSSKFSASKKLTSEKFITGDNNGELTIYSIDKMTPEKPVKAQQGAISAIEVLASNIVAVAGYARAADKINFAITVFDLENKKILFAITAHKQPITCLKLLAEGQFLASGSEDGKVKIWDLMTGRCVQEFDHGAAVTSLTIENNCLVSISNKAVKFWELKKETIDLSLINKYQNAATIQVASDELTVEIGVEAPCDPKLLQQFEDAVLKTIGAKDDIKVVKSSHVIQFKSEYRLKVKEITETLKVLAPNASLEEMQIPNLLQTSLQALQPQLPQSQSMASNVSQYLPIPSTLPRSQSAVPQMQQPYVYQPVFHHQPQPYPVASNRASEPMPVQQYSQQPYEQQVNKANGWPNNQGQNVSQSQGSFQQYQGGRQSQQPLLPVPVL